ncbi:MAG: peptidase inhibitor family I36 protein [Acidimicrobiia bacterium]
MKESIDAGVAHKGVIAALLAVAMAVVMIVSAPPAEAEGAPGTPPTGCGSSWACGYEDANYGGGKSQFKQANSSWSGWAIYNDDDSMFNNKTDGNAVRVYANANYSNDIYCVPAGWGYTNVVWYEDNTGESNTIPGDC